MDVKLLTVRVDGRTVLLDEPINLNHDILLKLWRNKA